MISDTPCQTGAETRDFPMVSVVMPVRNEGGFVARSLGAVLAQDYPAHRIEVIVADGLSNDGTRDIVERIAARHSMVRLINNPDKIASTGLNAATAMRHSALGRIPKG